MGKIGFVFCMILLLGLAAPMASAATIGLYYYEFDLDGNFSQAPAGVNLSSFSPTTGLGTITATVTGATSHQFIAFFDHEIDETVNTYFNEYGSVSGTPAGQSWEIDEPGATYGNIYSNFQAGSLDNTNGVPISSPDDVAMAMGFNFVLTSGQTATITLILQTTAPTSGFYLQQTDPDSGADIYLSGSLRKTGGGTSVPEPTSTLILTLLGMGFVGVAARFRK
jgi:hypothetical protein